MNILAVSYAFPPLAQPRSIQVSRLLGNLSADIVVICADDHEIRSDRYTQSPSIATNNLEIVKVPSRTTLARRTSNRISYRLLRSYWRRVNQVPDKYGPWKTLAKKRVERYIRETGFTPDVMVTFAQPFTDHLIGLELKRKFGFKWVAHFSDPWVDNPFHQYDPVTKHLNSQLERSVIENADLTVFTSTETVDLVFQKYSAEAAARARVLRHCYDKKLFSGEPVLPSDKLIIRYVGNFYGNRTPLPLIKALREINRKHPSLLSNFRFELIGDTNDSIDIDPAKTGLPHGLLMAYGPVDYSESLRLMAESDGLLIIDAPSHKSVFLPSKLIDYVGAGRPLFGFTPEGAARTLITELGGVAAPPGDASAALRLKEFLELLQDRRRFRYSVWGDEEVRTRYDVVVVADEFMKILRGIAEAHTSTIFTK